MDNLEKIRRQVVGEKWVTSDEVVKVRTTKNQTVEDIKRRTVRSIVLDCGHTIPVTYFVKVPTMNTRCHQCEIAAKEYKTDSE